MKQFILTVFIAVGFANISFASTADLFSYNEEAIEAEFSQIDQVESFVVENNGITFSEMQNQGHLTQFNLNWNAFDNSAAPMFGLSDMDWNSFVCGFCCWPVGIFTVLLNDDKGSDSKTSFLIGIGVNIVLGLLGGGGYAAGA
ncbi:MAG: hypothetical protein ACPGLV_17290 [Bacteroidia bacterium]